MYRSVNKICLSVSLWTSTAITTITLLFAIIGVTQNINQLNQQEEKRLKLVAPLIMNAISGELMIDDYRAIIAIKRNLLEIHELKSIEIARHHFNVQKNLFSSLKNHLAGKRKYQISCQLII